MDSPWFSPWFSQWFMYWDSPMIFFGTLICFNPEASLDHRTWRLNQPRFGFNRPTCRPNQSKLEDYINHIETMNICFFLMCFYEVDSDWVCPVRCGMSQDCKTIKSSIVKSFKSLGMHGSWLGTPRLGPSKFSTNKHRRCIKSSLSCPVNPRTSHGG